MSLNHTVTHNVEVTHENDLISLVVEYTNAKSIRARLSGNGKQNVLFVPSSTQQDGVSFILSKTPEELASLFDTLASTANMIDGDWLVEQLKAKLETMEMDNKADIEARLKNVALVPNLMALHAMFNDVMTAILGHNWVAEHSAVIIRKSKAWKQLVERARITQEALKSVLPS